MAICYSYNDEDTPEGMELMRKAQLQHADCVDKKCCCNCKHQRNACKLLYEQSNTDRDHWIKGIGSAEYGHYLCTHPNVGLVYFGQQTDDNLNPKHGICPLYEVNDRIFELYKIEDKTIFK